MSEMDFAISAFHVGVPLHIRSQTWFNDRLAALRKDAADLVAAVMAAAAAAAAAASAAVPAVKAEAAAAHTPPLVAGDAKIEQSPDEIAKVIVNGKTFEVTRRALERTHFFDEQCRRGGIIGSITVLSRDNGLFKHVTQYLEDDTLPACLSNDDAQWWEDLRAEFEYFEVELPKTISHKLLAMGGMLDELQRYAGAAQRRAGLRRHREQIKKGKIGSKLADVENEADTDCDAKSGEDLDSDDDGKKNRGSSSSKKRKRLISQPSSKPSKSSRKSTRLKRKPAWAPGMHICHAYAIRIARANYEDCPCPPCLARM
jgi:hypothetical protein